MNLKCIKCNCWSNDIPLKEIRYDDVNLLAHTKCGNCGHESTWITDAPVFIHISNIKPIINIKDV